MTTFTSTFVSATALVELDPATWTATGKVRIIHGNVTDAFTFSATNLVIGTVRQNALTSTFGKPTLAIPCAVAVSAGTGGFEGGAALTSPVTIKFVDQQGKVVKQDWS